MADHLHTLIITCTACGLPVEGNMLSETAILEGFYGYEPAARSHQKKTGHWPTKTKGVTVHGSVKPPGWPADRRQ